MPEICKNCKQVFNSHSKLMSHKLTAHRSEMGNVGFSGTRICRTCSEEFSTNSELMSHKLTFHRSEIFVGKSGPKLGSKFSKEHRDKLSKSLRIYYGTNDPSRPLGPQPQGDDRWCHAYEQWLQKVKRRDNYTCQGCGEKDRNQLVVHHSLPYRWFVRFRYDESNGITLCRTCHGKEEARLKKQRELCGYFITQLFLLHKNQTNLIDALLTPEVSICQYRCVPPLRRAIQKEMNLV